MEEAVVLKKTAVFSFCTYNLMALEAILKFSA